MAPELRACCAAVLLAGCGAQSPPRAPAPGDPPPHAREDTVSASEPRPSLPPVPRVSGALRLDVVYPAEGAALTTRGSNFIFGSTGTGAATLRINGHAVEVAPNGAFLGFLPVPPDGVYHLDAVAGDQRATLTRRVELPRPPFPPVAIDTASITPRGAMTLRPGERIAVRFRGAPGGSARLLLPDGTSVPLVERTAVERSAGFAQDRDPARGVTEYAGEFEARVPLRGRGDPPVLGSGSAGAAPARIEVTAGGRVATEVLPLTLALLEEPRTAVVASTRPDGQLLAAAVPGGGAPTAWPFPNGTRVRVTGERAGALRMQLTPELSLWGDAGSLRLEPAGTVPPEGSVGAVRVVPAGGWIDVRLATSDRLPFRVTAEGSDLVVEVFGAASRTNWLYYGTEDPMVRRVSWEQPSDDVYRLRVELAGPAWGWRTWWDESGALMLRVRRTPRIDPGRPLQGIHVAVDAGHPPLGATGPTRLAEADANLAIARRLAGQLRAAGAQVTETRPDAGPVALGLRAVLAERAGAHLFVSVHNNAFPDGVDPFANNGTTVFYNAPQSLGLARATQRELLRELGLRDLGIALSDLAVLRPTWMPGVLSETMFMMIPEQEAALRDPAVQERIASAHLRAIESFLREWAPRAP